jgi:hypothetical protein
MSMTYTRVIVHVRVLVHVYFHEQHSTLRVQAVVVEAQALSQQLPTGLAELSD